MGARRIAEYTEHTTWFSLLALGLAPVFGIDAGPCRVRAQEMSPHADLLGTV